MSPAICIGKITYLAYRIRPTMASFDKISPATRAPMKVAIALPPWTRHERAKPLYIKATTQMMTTSTTIIAKANVRRSEDVPIPNGNWPWAIFLINSVAKRCAGNPEEAKLLK
jgi:hypothetical protein